MRIFLLLLVLIQFPVYAVEYKKPLILESIVEDNEKRDLYKKDWAKKNCPDRKKTTLMLYNKCVFNKAANEANAVYPKRGTEEYCIKNYAPLSKEEALEKLDELKGLKEQVRRRSVGREEPGELVSFHIEREVYWLEVNLGLDRGSELKKLNEEYQRRWQD